MVKPKKLFAFLDSSFLGKIALLTDSNNSNLSVIDVVKILNSKNLTVELLDLANPNLELLNPKIWQNINHVWIGVNNNLVAGYIQGFLEFIGINYTGTGMLSAALSADPIKTKKIWQISGIATTPLFKWTEKFDWQELLGLFGLPLAVKSLSLYDKRIFKITHLDQTKEIYKQFSNLEEIIIEPWLTGDQYIVYIINDQALYPLKLNNGLFKEQNTIVNKDLEPDGLLNFYSMQKLALDAFLAIGGQGFGEVCILKDLNNDCWVLSIDCGLNLTKNSNFAVAAYKSGINFEQLVEQILITSLIKKNKDVLIPIF